MGGLKNSSGSSRARRALLTVAAVAVAGALQSDCLAPTEVTLDISTDVDCKTAAGFSTGITAAARGTAWKGQENNTETQACTAGDVGTLVLLPGADGPFSVRVVGAVGYSARACATGKGENGDPNPGDPNPKHPDWGCIQATRSLGFVPHRSLKLPVKLYAKCLGKVCPAQSTCDAEGTCVSDVVPDCPDGQCSDPKATGAGGASSSSSGQGGAGGGCGDTMSDKLNCGACGHSCLGGGCNHGQCQPIPIWSAGANGIPSGIAVDANYVYWAVSGSKSDGAWRALKDDPSTANDFIGVAGASDVAVTSSEILVAAGTPSCSLTTCPLIGSGNCSIKMMLCPLHVGGDPLGRASAWTVLKTGPVEWNFSGTPVPVPATEPVDVAVSNDFVVIATALGVVEKTDGMAPSAPWGGAPAVTVAAAASASLAVINNAVYVKFGASSPVALTGNEHSVLHLAAAAVKPLGHAVWSSKADLTIRYVAFDFTTQKGGVPVTIATMADAEDIATDDVAAYWTDKTTREVLKVALPP